MRSRKNLTIEGRVVVFHDLVEGGLVAVGDELRLTYHQQEMLARVTLDGQILTSEGAVFDNPSNAAAAVMGVESVNGWIKWKNGAGETLADLRLQLPNLDNQSESAGSSPPISSRVSRGGQTSAGYAETRKQTKLKINGRQVLFGDLVDHGLLADGDILALSYKNQTHSAVVTATRKLQLDDGREFANPSNAAAAAMQVDAINGWKKWETSTGKTIADLRLQLPGINESGPSEHAAALVPNHKASIEAPKSSSPRTQTKEPEFGLVPLLALGSAFRNRQELRDAGVHRPLQAGIDGNKNGAYSIVVSGGYVDDHDEGDVIIYTGHGGNDPQSKRQIKDQEWTRGNAALRLNEELGLPVRVTRGHKGDKRFSPSTGYRYDGVFLVESSWDEIGIDGFRICRFRLVGETHHSPHQFSSASPKAKPAPYVPMHAASALVETQVEPTTAEPFESPLSQTGPGQDWVLELLSTTRFVEATAHPSQRWLAKVEALLSFIDANGGQLSHQELADTLEIPQPRLRGLVATISRAINLDGYPVIQDDGERITLDRHMATTQFGLS